MTLFRRLVLALHLRLADVLPDIVGTSLDKGGVLDQ